MDVPPSRSPEGHSLFALDARRRLKEIAHARLVDKTLSRPLLKALILLAATQPADHRRSGGDRVLSADALLTDGGQLALAVMRALIVLATLPPDGSYAPENLIAWTHEIPEDTLTRTVKTLAALGIIERHPDADEYRLTPVPSGSNVLDGWPPTNSTPKRVSTRSDLSDLQDSLFAERHIPIVVLTEQSAEKPILPVREVRLIVGGEAEIFLLADHLTAQLRTRLGRNFGVSRGMARIFWPGLSLASDPFDHPLVAVLDVETPEAALAEFAHQFDLSRPHIRKEIKLIEALCSNAERQATRLQADIRIKDRELQEVRDNLHAAQRQLKSRDE